MTRCTASTAELYQHLQAALTDTMTAAGWVVDPAEPLGPGKTMVAAFQRPISADFMVAAFFDRPVMVVAATRDFGRLSVVAWLGVLYDPAARLWPLIFQEAPTPLLAVEAAHLDDPSHTAPVRLTSLGDVPEAVQALTGAVLRHGVPYAERYASLDGLVTALGSDQGYGPQFLPVVLATAGRVDEARVALNELGPRRHRGEDRLDREAAGRLRSWIDEGGVLPNTIISPPLVERRHFRCEDGDHSGCPHIQFTTALQVLPAGVRMVLPGSPELDFSLCRCACHADCSLAAQAEGVGWPEDCSCNATLQMRAQARELPPSDDGINVFATLGKGLDKGRRQRSARRAAAARATGRTKEEVEMMIDEEWSCHGLDRPTGMSRDLEISRITNPPDAIDQAMTTAKHFKDLVGAPFRVRHRVVSPEPTGQEERQTFEVATSHERIEIQIDERTRSRLGEVVDEGMVGPSLAKLFTVEIRDGEGHRVELWYRASPDGASELLASLSPRESDRFRRPLAAATRVGQRCTSKAFCVRVPHGRWSLGVSLPLSPNDEEGAPN